MEEGGVVEVAFRRHDGVRACSGETPLDVAIEQEVSVCDDRYRDRFLYGTNLLPIR